MNIYTMDQKTSNFLIQSNPTYSNAFQQYINVGSEHIIN